MKLNSEISHSFKVLVENLDKVEYYIDSIKSALLSGKLSIVTDDLLTFDLSIKQCCSFSDVALAYLSETGDMLIDIISCVKGNSHE